MGRLIKGCTKRKWGLFIIAIGVGIVLAVIIPFWGWILAMGCVIIGAGYTLMKR